MKKKLFLVFAIIFSINLVAQRNNDVLINDNLLNSSCEDFDDLINGAYVAEQLGGFWTTWFGLPGTDEDAIVSDLYSVSPPNSILVQEPTDLIYMFSNETITSGKWYFSNDVYIPTGKTGYWNLQQDIVAGVSWGMLVEFNSEMEMQIDAGSEGAAIITYAYDTWYHFFISIDLDSDWCEIYLDDELVVEYQWSLGCFGTPCPNTLGLANYYGNPYLGAPSGAHYDNVCFGDDPNLRIDENSLLTINIFPNPAMDFVSIAGSQNIESIIVYNFAGEKVLYENAGTPEFILNTSALNSGIYLFQVYFENDIMNKLVTIK